MKTLHQTITALLGLGFVLWSAQPAAAPDQAIDAAIQAVQQAPDPSAAIAAYANGFAIDRNNPKLYEAYVSRMVDLGLPEMAFHQAQTLTTLQSNNGLAWGVVAYVDARRAQMPEAIAAINLAGQFAPDNTFVQHTAGELLAWYDLKAEKDKTPDSSKEGLAKVRTLLDKRPVFTEAYSTAQKAYQSQTSNPAEPSASGPVGGAQPAVGAPPAAAPQAQAELAPAPTYTAPVVVPASSYYGAYPYNYPNPYYPDYSGVYMDWAPSYGYDWGPGWVAASPYWWWWPCGYWSGCGFYPFGLAFAFGDFDHFHHFHHDGHFGHGDHSGHGGHDGAFGHANNPAAWHNGAQGHNNFFGMPARPSTSTAQWARAGSASSTSASFAGANTGRSWWSGAGQRGSPPAAANGGVRLAPSPGFATHSSLASSGNGNVGRSTSMPWTSAARSSAASVPAGRYWAGPARAYSTSPAASANWAGRSYYAGNYAAARTAWAAQSYRSPIYSAPRYAMPAARSFGTYSGWANTAPRSFAGSYGGFRGGGGGFHGGGFGGGGFHGGGGGGGGFHGGGGGFHGGGGGGRGGGGHR